MHPVTLENGPVYLVRSSQKQGMLPTTQTYPALKAAYTVAAATNPPA